MAIVDTLIAIIVSDLLVALNLIIVIWIILRFVKKHVLPEVPHWIKQYRDTMLEYHAIVRAKGHSTKD